MDASAIIRVAAALGFVAFFWGLQSSLRREMRANTADLKAEIRADRTEIRADRTEVRAEIADLITEVRADRTELRAEIKALDDRIVSLIEDVGKIDSRVQRMEGYLIGRRGEAFRRADDEPTSERQA